MPKDYEGKIALGGLIFVFTWTFVALPFLYSLPLSSEPSMWSQNCSALDLKALGFWERTFCDPVAFFTLWLVAFTGILAISTIGLWLVTRAMGKAQARDMKRSIELTGLSASAARDQVELSRRALEDTQRAFVFMSKIHAMAGVKKDTGKVIDWTFFPIWENSGSTPTKTMYMHTNWFYFASQIPEEFDFQDLSKDVYNRPPIFLGPKATTWGGASEIPIGHIWATKKKEGRLLLWGWVEYDDVFEGTKRHRTEYCVEVIVSGDPETYETGPSAAPHVPFQYNGFSRHNGADEECTRPLQTGSKKNPVKIS